MILEAEADNYSGGESAASAQTFFQTMCRAARCAELVITAPDRVVENPVYPDAALAVADTLLNLGMSGRAEAVLKGTVKRLPERSKRVFLRQAVFVYVMHPGEVSADALAQLADFRKKEFSEVMRNFIEIGAFFDPQTVLAAEQITGALRIAPPEEQYDTILKLRRILDGLPANERAAGQTADARYGKRLEELEPELSRGYFRRLNLHRGIKSKRPGHQPVLEQSVWLFELPRVPAELRYFSSGEPDDAVKLLLIALETRMGTAGSKPPSYPELETVIRKQLELISSPVAGEIRRELFDRLVPDSGSDKRTDRVFEIYYYLNRLLSDPVLAVILKKQPQLEKGMLTEALLKTLLTGPARGWNMFFSVLLPGLNHDVLRSDLFTMYADRELTGRNTAGIRDVINEYLATVPEISSSDDRMLIWDTVRSLLPPEAECRRFDPRQIDMIAGRVAKIVSALMAIDRYDRTADSVMVFRKRLSQAHLFISRLSAGRTGEELLKVLSTVYTLGPVKFRALATVPVDWNKLTDAGIADLLKDIGRYPEQSAAAVISEWRRKNVSSR